MAGLSIYIFLGTPIQYRLSLEQAGFNFDIYDDVHLVNILNFYMYQLNGVHLNNIKWYSTSRVKSMSARKLKRSSTQTYKPGMEVE